jgi:diguanylate cyclase
MIAGWQRLRHRLWPPVPDAVRDELSLLRYNSLKSQVPMLYAMLVLLIAVTLFGTPPSANPLVAWGLPVLIMAIISGRILIWWRRRHDRVSPAAARHMIDVMTMSSCSIGAVASLWCVGSWIYSPPDIALYYPLLLAMGSLAAAFCVSNVRAETVLNLSIGLFPISGVMIISGSTMDMAAGTSILVAALFLIRMILDQHARLIAQLQLQQQMRALANTDELTGLLNRRGLRAEIAQLSDAGRGMALVLLDLDGFKAVNDRHGHATGDELLTEVGQRLREICGPGIHAARMGGDEFAALIPHGTTTAAAALADRILLSLIAPIGVDGRALRIGASAGVAEAAPGEANINSLFAKADGALYAAKREQQREPSAAGRVRPSGTRG